jgi:hypothetical protein
MKQIRVFFLSLILITAVDSNAVSQITPSVYTGIEIGRNIGGTAQLGGEIKQGCFSFHAAINYVEDNGLFQPKFDNSLRYNYNLGVNIHSQIGIFAGIGYGYLDGPIIKLIRKKWVISMDFQ